MVGGSHATNMLVLEAAAQRAAPNVTILRMQCEQANPRFKGSCSSATLQYTSRDTRVVLRQIQAFTNA